jgi:hypothetical protein
MRAELAAAPNGENNAMVYRPHREPDELIQRQTVERQQENLKDRAELGGQSRGLSFNSPVPAHRSRADAVFRRDQPGECSNRARKKN